MKERDMGGHDIAQGREILVSPCLKITLGGIVHVGLSTVMVRGEILAIYSQLF